MQNTTSELWIINTNGQKLMYRPRDLMTLYDNVHRYMHCTQHVQLYVTCMEVASNRL